MIMRIKELRLNAGIAQCELGAQMGVGQTTVSMWENEAALPKTRQIPLLSEILGVPIGDLFVSHPRDCLNDTTEMGA